MSVNVNVVMRFAGNAVTAGLAKAKASVVDFGRGLGGLKKAFSGMGMVGSLFGIGALGRIFSEVMEKSKKAMETMDFSEISYKNASAVMFLHDRFETMWNGVVSGAARAAGSIIRFTSKVGAVAGGLFEAAVNPNVSWREGLFGAGDAVASGNDTTKQAEERRREAEMRAYLRHTASGLEIIARRRKEAAEAAQKEAEAQQKIADEISRSAEESQVKAKHDAKSLSALAVGPMSQLRALDKQRRQEDRDQRELDRLLRHADKKLKNKEIGIGVQKLTRREELALASREGVANGNVMRNIETYTKKTADVIERALALGTN